MNGSESASKLIHQHHIASTLASLDAAVGSTPISGDDYGRAWLDGWRAALEACGLAFDVKLPARPALVISGVRRADKGEGQP